MAYVKTLSIDGTKYNIKDDNAVQCGTSSSSVAQTVYGWKTFATGIDTKGFTLTKRDTSKEGGEIAFQSADAEANAGQTIVENLEKGIYVVGNQKVIVK